VKTEFKEDLETRQDELAASSYGGGSWDSGGDSFFDNFSGSGFKKGKGKGAVKEGERKGSEGAKPKTGPGKLDADYDNPDEEYEDDHDDEEEDYYGDESSMSLSSISTGAIRNFELEGYSLEDMQMILYGEYGVKASIVAIRRRLQDARSQGRRKKTGKTRKSRQKKRNARFNNNDEDSIDLPDGPVQVQEVASMLDLGGGDVIKYLMMNKGMMCTLQHTVEPSMVKEIAEAFGKAIRENDDGDDDDDDEEGEYEEDGDEVVVSGVSVENLPRHPIVTIMGHVDHGKTSLLDSIRNARVASGEAGGITQGVSAFKVKTMGDKDVTFVDTPGHAAFSEMRQRGASMTDIVVLVVAADDGIMVQTKECIVAAKQAKCPIVIAINKIDKEGADTQKIITDLTNYDLVAESLGGDIQVAEVSAKNGVGIDSLLEKILLQAEVMNLKAPVDCEAQGTVIEASVSKGLGTVVTALVQKGTLSIGDYVLAGPSWGRVRRILTDQNLEVDTAGPGTPVQIIGMNTMPNAGDNLSVAPDEASVRNVAEARQRISRQSVGSVANSAILANAAAFTEGNADTREIINVPIVIKSDVAGSGEALRSSIEALELSDEEAICRADIVYSGVGDVTSSDVSIAATAKAKIIAFNVAAQNMAMEDARAGNVEIGYYNVVYELLDELEHQIKTTLAPPPPGKLVGEAVIQKVFKLGKAGKVAGCLVSHGVMKSDSMVRIMRGKRNPVYLGKLTSLKVVKDSVGEVPNGSECGITFEDFQDFEEGDVIECFFGGETSDEN
jgi:translation initiation factor IF-2